MNPWVPHIQYFQSANMKSFLARGWATQLALAEHKPQMMQVKINIKKYSNICLLVYFYM